MDVDALLAKAKAKEEERDAQLHPERAEEFDMDVGNMAGLDPRPVSLRDFDSAEGRQRLAEVARENTQLIVNELFALPVKKDAEGVIAMLPRTEWKIPREKPVPFKAPKTRWEKFAEMKGIRKKQSRPRLAYDEASGEYKPRYGYGRAPSDNLDAPWVEVPDNADPYEDQFEKMAEARKARVSKNEQQRLKNIATARLTAKGRRPTTGAIKKELQQAIKVGRVSTASAGVFDESLPGEDKIRRSGRKKKLPAVGMTADERKNALELLGKMERKPAQIKTAMGLKSTLQSGGKRGGKGKGAGARPLKRKGKK